MSEQMALFDYSILDAETRITVKQRAERIQERNRTIALSIWENGRDLHEAQQELAKHGYGCFIEWAESETGFSIRTVYNFISVYQNFDCATVAQSKLTAKVLYLLAAPSTPESVRMEAIERAQAGEAITHKVAQSILSNGKAAELPPNAMPVRLQPTPANNVRTVVAPYSPSETARYIPAQRVEVDEYEEMEEEAEEEDQIGWDTRSVTVQDAHGWQSTAPANMVAIGEDEIVERAEEIKAKSSMTVHYSSESPEHYTPQEIIEATVAVMGAIDLDPCSNSKEAPNVPALEHFTIADDGLSQSWFGGVYMNPPYGRSIGDWTRKLVSEYVEGNVTEAIALVPSRTDTQWWQAFRDYPVCFVTGRLVFIGNDDPAPFPSAVFYLGENVEQFYRVFSAFGDVWTRIKDESCTTSKSN